MTSPCDRADCGAMTTASGCGKTLGGGRGCASPTPAQGDRRLTAASSGATPSAVMNLRDRTPLPLARADPLPGADGDGISMSTDIRFQTSIWTGTACITSAQFPATSTSTAPHLHSPL